jgi:hypothetical protein
MSKNMAKRKYNPLLFLTHDYAIIGEYGTFVSNYIYYKNS